MRKIELIGKIEINKYTTPGDKIIHKQPFKSLRKM